MVLLFLLIPIFCLLSSVYSDTNTSCPQETDLLRRLGDTRFYIVHKNERGNYVNRSKADEQCKKFGLKMARIDNMRTFAIVGRNLEKLVLENELKDTWYWLPVVYDSYYKFYRWSENRERVKFHNYLYRKIRPTGIDGVVTYDNVYHWNRSDPQCLTVALPWFGPCEDAPSYDIRGNQFIVDERPCESIKTRHVICESKLSECNSTKKGAFLLTEDKVDYFENGPWIFGNRTFLINWQSSSLDESRKYCDKLKMKLYEPIGEDDGLIPFIKMWSREITMTTFWTDMKWYRKEQEYRLTNRKNISGILWRDYFDEKTGKMKRIITPGKSKLDSKSSKHDYWYCVSMGLAYEFGGQTPCSEEMLNNSQCIWHFREFSPSSCKNYHATICTSKENKPDLHWNPKYTDNVALALNETATVSFGVYHNNFTQRSTYKQTFGSLVRPSGYHMLRMNNSVWSNKPRERDYFGYDYLETYWVVDEEFFNKDINSNCTITTPKYRDQGFDRVFKKVPCSEWHFYLCQRLPIKRSMNFTAEVNPWKEMVWEEGPQERAYPILLDTN